MRISVELVPRSADALCRELDVVRTFPTVDTVNVPDLLRFSTRSWEACRMAQDYLPRTIPHLRSMDFEPARIDALCATLTEHRIREALVVTGDPPQDMGRPVYPTRPTDLIRALKSSLPDLTVYAALDPYRSGFREESDYARRKRDAGADGFFTQPFFDLRLMDLYAELMEGENVFWGVAPVMTAKSRTYWETRNRALFPRDFTPTPEWNRQFAQRALELVRSSGGNIYFMPIRIDLPGYLTGLFGSSTEVTSGF